MEPRTEQGFSVLELLVCVGVAGVIFAAAVPAYSEYRARSYESRCYHLIEDIRTVIYSAEIELDEERADTFSARSNSAGVLTGRRVSEFLPHVKVPPNMMLDIWYDQHCERSSMCGSGAICCPVIKISAWNCKGGRALSWFHWRGGSDQFIWLPQAGC